MRKSQAECRYQTVGSAKFLFGPRAARRAELSSKEEALPAKQRPQREQIALFLTGTLQYSVPALRGVTSTSEGQTPSTVGVGSVPETDGFIQVHRNDGFTALNSKPSLFDGPTAHSLQTNSSSISSSGVDYFRCICSCVGLCMIVSV